MTKPILYLLAGVLSLASAGSAAAQESLDEILERFDGFVAEGNYPKALEELEWARRALAKAHWARIETLFPERLGAMTGEELRRQEVLGIQTHARRYADAAGNWLEVTLMDGSNSIGLAAIEQLARLLGAQVGAEPVRIDGLTATLVARDEEGSSLLTVQLQSDATLRFKAAGGNTELLLEAAREFGVAQLDAYLSGANPEVKSRI